MSTKVKGLIRGIKNISSHIFDDEKKQDIQIGQPTDVKHVAHVGGDGPAAESTSWMWGFDASKPLDKTGSMVETPAVKWVSEDSTRKKTQKDDSCHKGTHSTEISRELSLIPRSTKNHHRSMDNNMASETLSKDSSSSQLDHTRRHHKGSRDVPKRPSRRIRKPKEESLGDGSTQSFTKSTNDYSELVSNDK